VGEKKADSLGLGNRGSPGGESRGVARFWGEAGDAPSSQLLMLRALIDVLSRR